MAKTKELPAEPSVKPPADADPAPEPLAAGPRPMGVGIMRIQKQRYRDWIAAGGTPPIYT